MKPFAGRRLRRWNSAATVFCCAACDTDLTLTLAQLPSVPDVSATEGVRDPVTRRAR
ncbi:hypothetical protein ACWCXH_29105 [Kitasatospora sp. NPDC001660]